jgi:hypothetical protein
VGPGVNIGRGSSIDPFNIDGPVTLTPGSYHLRIRIGVDAQEEFGIASYDVTFETLQNVPEPGTAFFLMAGALATSARAFFRPRASKGDCARGVN